MCHPSHTPGGCGHGVGVDLSQENRETKVRTIVNSVIPDAAGVRFGAICTTELVWLLQLPALTYSNSLTMHFYKGLLGGQKSHTSTEWYFSVMHNPSLQSTN